MADDHTDDDQRIALIRHTMQSGGWDLLTAEMRRIEESENREMWALNTGDDRRYELAAMRHGRRQVLDWFQEQIDRKAR